jgi:hypothetical protein
MSKLEKPITGVPAEIVRTNLSATAPTRAVSSLPLLIKPKKAGLCIFAAANTAEMACSATAAIPSSNYVAISKKNALEVSASQRVFCFLSGGYFQRPSGYCPAVVMAAMLA